MDRPYQAHWLGLVAVSAPFAGAKSGGARGRPDKEAIAMALIAAKAPELEVTPEAAAM
jgi:hypothetical protein